MATYAIGDIQGCYNAFQALLNKIQFNPHQDTLWIAGDLVNRGDNNVDTLRFIKQLGSSAKVVLGNHDLHLLAHAYGVRALHPSDTLQDILAAPDKDSLLHWLQQQPLMHYDALFNVAMTHAGIPPIWGIKKALRRAHEVETVLRDSTLAPNFFFNMYGNQPDTWNKTLTGTDRLRIITNYFTRMRFCDANGKLELATKNNPNNAPAKFAPWFSHPSPKWQGTTLVFGHWAALEGKTDTPSCIALDTGCVWGGSLTAYCLENKKTYSVNA